MAEQSNEDVTALSREISKIEESATYSAQGQFEQGKRWRTVNLLLGAPAAILAAISGATALGDAMSSTWVGVLALISAALGATHTTLNASHRQETAQTAANLYLEIQTAARQLRELDLAHLDYPAARAVLADLTTRRDEVNRTADPISRFAYRRAQKNINSGGQDYAVDQGSN